MLLVRMGWLTPPLRLSLIKAIIKWAGRLLNYPQEDIDAKLTSSYLTPEFLDSIVKCRSPHKSNGRGYQRGDLVTNIFGQIERLQFDPETLDEFRDYVRQWERVPGQRMLLGANLSIRAAIGGREDSVGFYKCSGCDSEAQLRAYGARHSKPLSRGKHITCGRWCMIENAYGDLIQSPVPGYCESCSNRGLLMHNHQCASGSSVRFQSMQPPVNFDPTIPACRNVMCVRFDSSGVLEKIWPGSLTTAATEVRATAVRLFEEDGGTDGLESWMYTSHHGNTRVVKPDIFARRMSDIIIGRNGIEDGSFVIDGKTYSGIPIELPAGHAGLSAPPFKSHVWSKKLYKEYFE